VPPDSRFTIKVDFFSLPTFTRYRYHALLRSSALPKNLCPTLSWRVEDDFHGSKAYFSCFWNQARRVLPARGFLATCVGMRIKTPLEIRRSHPAWPANEKRTLRHLDARLRAPRHSHERCRARLERDPTGMHPTLKSAAERGLKHCLFIYATLHLQICRFEKNRTKRKDTTLRNRFF
jgi:hypothetical protein